MLRASHISQASISKPCGRSRKCGKISSLSRSRTVAGATEEISVKQLAATPLPQLGLGCGELGGRNTCIPLLGSPFA